MAAALEREQIPQLPDAHVQEQWSEIMPVACSGACSGLPGKDRRKSVANVKGLGGGAFLPVSQSTAKFHSVTPVKIQVESHSILQTRLSLDCKLANTDSLKLK